MRMVHRYFRKKLRLKVGLGQVPLEHPKAIFIHRRRYSLPRQGRLISLLLQRIKVTLRHPRLNFFSWEVAGRPVSKY
jgi:hypothetical protein